MKDYNIVNEWSAIAFASPHKITNEGYVKNICFLRRTRFGAPNENFTLETRRKLCLCTGHYFLCEFSAKMATYSLVIDNVYFVIGS